jgi:outer membrane lipoprotein LolB
VIQRAVGRLARLAWLACVLGLGACAALQPPPPVAGDAWSGRVGWSIAATAGQPAQQAGATFELRGSASEGWLELTSPLGTLLARATWQGGSAELQTVSGSSRHDDLASLSRAAFGGQEMPLAALFDWLRGRPWPGAPHEAEPDGFSQLGWRVDVRALGQGLLTARRPAEPAVTLRLRLEAAP